MIGRAKNRVAWAGGWHSAHNNQRYEELLPRLANVDRFYVRLSPFWPLRGIQRRIWLPLLVRWLGWRYPLLFCTDWRQIRMIRARVVCDLDDPVFSASEIAAVNRLNVDAIVVTSELVRQNLRAAGVCNPIEVVPQGVRLGPIDPDSIRVIRQRYSPDPNEIVVGLHQPRFDFASELSAGTAEQMYAVDQLLVVMRMAQVKDPRLVLWLVGRPSAGVAAFAAQHPWVRLIGYQPHAGLMEYVSAFDIGVYPRTLDLKGRSSIKVLEYLACGVPVVGFAVDEMRLAAKAGAGIAVDGVGAFAEALAALANDPGRRAQMGEVGKKEAARYDWEVLSLQYRNLLNRYALRETTIRNDGPRGR
jgi:glycosyltransferase involved in cell wall biosynthesis